MLEPTGTVGVSTHVTQVADMMASRGQRVRIVSPESWLPHASRALLAPGRLLRRAGSERAVRMNRLVHRRFLELALHREFRREIPYLVYAQDPRSAFAALQARGASQVPVAMVVHYNESQAEELVERNMIARGGSTDNAVRAFETEVIPRLDGLVFVSEFMRRHLHARLPQVRDIPSAVVPNFVRRSEDVPMAAQIGDCISVGSLVARKNHAYLLRVLAAARRDGHRYTLTLVGDGPERRALQRLARELDVEDHVLFTGVRRDVDRLLPRHRVYVHSSTMENCPFALIEAFRSGLAVVTGAVGGIPEVVGTDGAGRFWDLADPEAGARVLSGLLEGEGALAEAAGIATSRFKSRFDAGVASDQLVHFLYGLRNSPPT